MRKEQPTERRISSQRAVALLELHRLKRGWTFAQLAREMAAAGFVVNERTLHYLVNDAPSTSQPTPRVLFPIREYLAHVRKNEVRAADAKYVRAMTRDAGVSE